MHYIRFKRWESREAKRIQKDDERTRTREKVARYKSIKKTQLRKTASRANELLKKRRQEEREPQPWIDGRGKKQDVRARVRGPSS